MSAFVKVNTIEDAEYWLHVDRISSFHKTTREDHGEVTEVQTVYGNTIHLPITPEEFADLIRIANYNFTFFGN